jgi:hypothetical protein
MEDLAIIIIVSTILLPPVIYSSIKLGHKLAEWF